MNSRRSALSFLFVFSFFLCSAQDLPYPLSPAIKGIEIDWSTHQRHAQGSDNFQLTWADDGHLYGIWGDGGGFAGTNNKYRVSFGVARIEGGADDYTGYDRYGHKETAEFEATVIGKSWGVIGVRKNLYAWVHPDREGGLWGNWEDHHRESRLFISKDKGASWQPADWAFTPKDDLIGGGILQFGRNYSEARDKYVYHYLVQPGFHRNNKGQVTELQVPGRIYLARVNKKKIMKRGSYEFFAGFSGEKVVWSRELKDKKPVFEDKNGVGTPVAVSYNPALKRYLLTTEHSKPEAGMMGIFDAPEPWGPWSVVSYAGHETWFGHDHAETVPANCFFWCFPTKWISGDGGTAVMVFTGAGGGNNNDSFNTVRVKFLLPR